ncbi:hypothetical protein D3C71_1642200 [compost metagenome]
MDEDTVFDMPLHCTSQNNPFNGASNPLQLDDIITVTNPLHILFNNRATIKLFCNIVSSCSDNLYPALVRLSVRITANKGRQEGVMNINNLVAIVLNK